MSESIILEIDGNLYPLTALIAAQDSSRIDEGEVANIARIKFSNDILDPIATSLAKAAEQQQLFTSDITPWREVYADDTTPLAHVEGYLQAIVIDAIGSATGRAVAESIRVQATELAEQVFNDAANDIAAAYINKYMTWLAASEYARRALRGDGVKPAIDGQQLLAIFTQQCQQICDLIDSITPQEQDPQ